MKRRLLAIFCVLTLLFSTVPACALAGGAQRAADILATLSLIEPIDANYLNLKQPASRAQAVDLLVKLAGAQKAAEQDQWMTGYWDIPDWADDVITYASHQGWVKGIGVTEFGAELTINGNEWFAFLLRMLGYSEKNDEFSEADAAVFARRVGLTSRAYQLNTMTLGDLYQTAVDALTFPYPHSATGETVASHLVSAGICSQSAMNALDLLNPQLTARQVVDRYSSAVFMIRLYETQREITRETPSGDASGFFINSDGLAVTNYHSIEDAVYATVTLVTGEVYPVDRVIWYNTAMDLAVIRVSRTALDGKSTPFFACLPMVGSDEVCAGDVVYSLSNPLGITQTIGSGIAEAVNVRVGMDNFSNLPCIMNNAAISEGSSGGALLNVYGQVIGVTTGAYTRGNSMYLAITVNPLLHLDLTGTGNTFEEVKKTERAKRTA